MIINVTRIFVDVDSGNEMKEDRETGEKSDQGSLLVETIPFTLRTTCIRSLILPFKSDESEQPEKKQDRYELALKIRNSDHPDLSKEEIKLLKERIAKAWPGAGVSGQAASFFDEDVAASIMKKKAEKK